jgi:hypothetical protein
VAGKLGHGQMSHLILKSTPSTFFAAYLVKYGSSFKETTTRLELWPGGAQKTFFPFQSKASGHILFDQVCKQLSLLEVDYFGLEYQDGHGITVREILKRSSFVLHLFLDQLVHVDSVKHNGGQFLLLPPPSPTPTSHQ